MDENRSVIRSSQWNDRINFNFGSKLSLFRMKMSVLFTLSLSHSLVNLTLHNVGQGKLRWWLLETEIWSGTLPSRTSKDISLNRWPPNPVSRPTKQDKSLTFLFPTVVHFSITGRLGRPSSRFNLTWSPLHLSTRILVSVKEEVSYVTVPPYVRAGVEGYHRLFRSIICGLNRGNGGDDLIYCVRCL